MKSVLITGANSYIGTTFERWIQENAVGDIQTETVDMIDESWKTKNFGAYDTIFHVAGIAHADVGSVSEEQKKLYYKVNTDLTVECATKAKSEGVKQFIFMSSIIVYGESAGIGKQRVITKNTPLTPANFYGDSKVKAEEGLFKLADENFKIVVLRPPMIYGKGSKGNYPLLAKMARKSPFFPNVQNQRSMLYIGNLCKFVELMIRNEEQGVFFPQNKNYVQTSEMVRQIAEAHDKKIRLIKSVNWLLVSLGNRKCRISALINKAFGNIVYEHEMSKYMEEYRVYDLEESIHLTEC
ncbi:MAG: NAD-dependent epimerase/dehydratase family protein [Lachnospiraceae bacterium]|nr:NAD-dependent epimerase/dehydratase family protein [Lachnospiraceae bacterium]